MMKKMVLLSLACHIALASFTYNRTFSSEDFTLDQIDIIFVKNTLGTETPKPPTSPALKATPKRAKPSKQASLVKASYQGLNNPLPPYPLVARKRRHEGNVTLTLHISTTGQCKFVHLKDSSGHSSLDEAALKTASTWHFNPARRGNKNTEDQLDVTFKFTLTGLEVA